MNARSQRRGQDVAAPVAEGVAGTEPHDGDQEAAIALVGARIRALRQRRGLTLKDLAAATGVSVSMLSMLERGLSSASIGTLVSVASSLGVPMPDLFEQAQDLAVSPVSRRGDQPVVQTGLGAVRRIVHRDARAGVELAINEYAVSGASGARATHHRGREFGVVLSGHLRVELDGVVHEMAPGDAIAYDSTLPHRISNPGSEPAIAAWVNIDLS